MDVLLHFLKAGKAARVDLKDTGAAAEYDAVLRSHSRLGDE